MSQMPQTAAHEDHNPQLLDMLPLTAQRVMEVGCSSGALAREFKQRVPGCHYVGMDVMPEYIPLAQRHCDSAFALDIEQADAAFWQRYADRDCWVFGDTLEHLRDPWRVLRQIRSVIPAHGSVVACVPNAQNWWVQARLAVGWFKYEDYGLFDRTHLRWFTWDTLQELFADCGFAVEGAMEREDNNSASEPFLPLIAEMARLGGGDPERAVADARVYQYVLKAHPV